VTISRDVAGEKGVAILSPHINADHYSLPNTNATLVVIDRALSPATNYLRRRSQPQHTFAFLDRLVYEKPKKPKPKGASAMQPGASAADGVNVKTRGEDGGRLAERGEEEGRGCEGR